MLNGLYIAPVVLYLHLTCPNDVRISRNRINVFFHPASKLVVFQCSDLAGQSPGNSFYRCRLSQITFYIAAARPERCVNSIPADVLRKHFSESLGPQPEINEPRRRCVASENVQKNVCQMFKRIMNGTFFFKTSSHLGGEIPRVVPSDTGLSSFEQFGRCSWIRKSPFCTLSISATNAVAARKWNP
ncbi:hypothetical protein CEXT_369701 [Caerostris extrusa]|uniref:Uncharacterized protein n=1 Tax=Caerostris extrusa TaxID=172846 RepID=A0AAV4UP88_CAEEX|nr:hypothetical protein CEXT_369701 [Caerostris extrusa]